jgi:acetyl-CoA carboxylase biotin carboxyl carrier protein
MWLCGMQSGFADEESTMELTPEDVQEILRILEESSFDELYLETPQLKLIVRRGPSGTRTAPVPSSTEAPSDETVPSPQEDRSTVLPSTTTPVAPGISSENRMNDQLVPIMAPLKGIFYRAPRPGAPPFVDIGSIVQDDTVVGIIEVMKLMHSIQAGVTGTIVQVCVENGQAVDRGQPLFLVRATIAADTADTPITP